MENKILIIDIETTGFLKDGGNIVEIGAVELDLTSGEITEVFSSLCREKILTAKHRDAWIFSNSDLTVDQVREAPEFEEVAVKFQEVIDRYPAGATAFNRVFDFTFLQDRGLKFPKQLPCPMILSTDICMLPGKYGSYKWPKVEEAFSHFFPDFPYVEKHRGADDAYHEAMIVHKLYQLGHFTI
ncbi:MAG: 3'-5' exonuclease [Bacteroidia bacterium]|nr:3'-5' exonuclease [Bacteroidia bacterium]